MQLLPARAILSCALNPSKIGASFNVVELSGTPKVPIGAGVDFRFCLFRDETTLYDPSNIGIFYLTIKTKGSPASAPLVQVSILGNAITPCTLEDWKNGIGQHAVVSLLSSHTSALSAGQYDITIWGTTTDAPADYDLFGTSTLEAVACGISPGTPDPVAGVTYVTQEMLNAAIGSTIKQGANPAGAWFALQSEDGKHVLRIGIGNDGVPYFQMS